MRIDPDKLNIPFTLEYEKHVVATIVAYFPQLDPMLVYMMDEDEMATFCKFIPNAVFKDNPKIDPTIVDEFTHAIHLRKMTFDRMPSPTYQ